MLGLRLGAALKIARTIGALGALSLLAGCSQIGAIAEVFRHPSKPFAETPRPTAPDYAESRAWLAFPGRNDLSRSAPAGLTPVDESKAPADVFFIHPTSYLKNDVWNAPYDAVQPYNPAILMNQVSAFNGCCRMYAPQYRQASLHALGASREAVDLAYADIERAFRYYIAHENHGRPFIIASHSQGSAHAVRLLQAEILGTPLQGQLVAAYVIGAYVPSNFGQAGLPICESATQTGCVVAWNASQVGKTGARKLTQNQQYWWRGGWVWSRDLSALCVNPLTWNETGAAPASANPGSAPFPDAPYPTRAVTLPALVPHMTGAVCKDRLLDVDVPKSQPGFRDTLSFLYGSYHRTDYGLVYGAIRANAIQRVAAMKEASK